MPLRGKTVYITGGTGGIGKHLVKLMEDAGAKITLYDTKTQGDLAANIEETCLYLRENTPDILINMAGYNVLDYCENQNLDEIIALNMMAPIRLSQAVLPTMKKRNSGHIINVGSMTALIPLPHLTGYVAAKSGLKGFNDSLRRELSGTNIAVTHIVPRAVKTNMNKGAKAEINARARVHYDDPETIAELILGAIVKQRKELRFGFPERLFAILNALIPALIDQGLEKHRRIGEDVLNKKPHKETMPSKAA